MSYVTRPIRGFQITFLTSVQPSDRLPRFVREHSRLSRSFSTTSRIYRLFVISRRAALQASRTSDHREYFTSIIFPFGLQFFVSLSQVFTARFFVSWRFIPYYSQRFSRSIAFPRSSPFYSETFLHDFRVLASTFQRFTPQQQCTEHSFLFHFVSFLACIASSFWCFRSRRIIYVVAFYFRVHSFDRIAPTPQRQPPSRSEQTDRQRRQTRLLETVDNEADIKVSLSVCLLNRPGR